MRKRQNQLALLVILAVTAFSLVVTWPGNPDKYLPDFIPWPRGHGINVAGFDRDEFRLGLDLAGGVSVTLEATGTATSVRLNESVNSFLRRTGADLDNLLDLNDSLRTIDPDDYDRPLPDSVTALILPLDLEGEDLASAMQQAREIIELRVSGFGVSEAEVTQFGDNRINVQIPGVTSEEAADLVGSVALLEFRQLDPTVSVAFAPPNSLTVRNALEDAFIRDLQELPPEDLRLFEFPLGDPEEDVIVAQGRRWIPARGRDNDGQERALTGEFLIADSVRRDLDAGGQPALAFRFNSEGARLFEQITRRLVPRQEPLGIFLDRELVSAPIVNAVIQESGIITGLANDEARVLRRQLRAGSLPLNLTVIQQTEVAASLGEDFVIDTVQAGLIAFLAIILFMIVYYRLPGVLGALALCVYAAAVMATFKLVPVTLTLAGIAGFVLSLGLAVDGNVLIFERMREELRLRRNLQGAIDVGFRRAWPAIRDSNVSTLITVAILYVFGDQFNANLIKSFAITLFVGTLFSVVTSIFVTRTFLNLTVGLVPTRDLRLFGVRLTEEEEAAADLGAQTAPGRGGGD